MRPSSLAMSYKFISTENHIQIQPKEQLFPLVVQHTLSPRQISLEQINEFSKTESVIICGLFALGHSQSISKHLDLYAKNDGTGGTHKTSASERSFLEFKMLASSWRENKSLQLGTTIRFELRQVLNLRSASPLLSLEAWNQQPRVLTKTYQSETQPYPTVFGYLKLLSLLPEPQSFP